MSLAGALERLQEEAICPICLEYMNEPVSVDCGHNFCRGCIVKHCQEKGLWADGPFSCPQCRASCHRSGFRPNRQLANIVESIRQLGLRGGVGTEPGTPLCAQHDERLKLFCEEDEEAICVVCRESLHHRPHTVYPIEEAAQVYKVGEAGGAGVPVLPWCTLGTAVPGDRVPGCHCPEKQRRGWQRVAAIAVTLWLPNCGVTQAHPYPAGCTAAAWLPAPCGPPGEGGRWLLPWGCFAQWRGSPKPRVPAMLPAARRQPPHALVLWGRIALLSKTYKL